MMMVIQAIVFVVVRLGISFVCRAFAQHEGQLAERAARAAGGLMPSDRERWTEEWAERIGALVDSDRSTAALASAATLWGVVAQQRMIVLARHLVDPFGALGLAAIFLPYGAGHAIAIGSLTYGLHLLMAHRTCVGPGPYRNRYKVLESRRLSLDSPSSVLLALFYLSAGIYMPIAWGTQIWAAYGIAGLPCIGGLVVISGEICWGSISERTFDDPQSFYVIGQERA